MRFSEGYFMAKTEDGREQLFTCEAKKQRPEIMARVLGQLVRELWIGRGSDTISVGFATGAALNLPFL